MELSYSQNLEDYHLSLAFTGQAAGTYIDVGAGHPVADNVSFWFYERGWRGIVVEPQPELAALYQRLRPRDVAVRSLVGRHCGEMDFHVVERLHGLSTTVEGLAQKAKDLGADYQTVRTPVTTLAKLCEKHDLGAIDFLKIDVEGAEGDVLFGGDWQRFRPKVIVAEAVTPLASEQGWQDWEPFLLAQGYRFALFDTLNRFYVAQEHPDILARLPSERAPWHAVRHMYEIGRAPDNELHPDHALAQDLARGFWASLPHLDPDLLTSLLARARRISKSDDIAALASTVDTEPFRAALGRIACGYDGGQIVDE
ncbi:FkbM family methyltransferase [Bradyrhizobium roseum]|uniref:FkbM family methyltransferase n=1 Tax=Bradyrhizobium roseum TaxID=3056648 RepID=UPI002606B9A3|nr:FkbM family methyltransferase [Bradyrhizobium roseus]WKA29698.1 FkbM family methyltransferase [Bradyrhizobium roseus]